MKIKKLLSTSLLFFLPFFLILFILFCINILIKDFSFAHKSHNKYLRSMDWVKYSFFLNKEKLTNFLFKLNNNEEGLPKVEIYIPEKTSNKLLSNIPNSTKQYLKSEMLINNEKKQVRLRYFGDNPTNWMFDQKSIRIKTKKSEIVNRRRFFEYRSSQNKILDEYVAFKIAKKLKLLVSEVKLVELFVNNKSVGIYIEKEKLNESFLRRNKIMPINLYKGEASHNSEKKIGLEYNLDQNPGLWEKLSFLNSTDEDDYTDLIRLSKNIRNAENSPNDLNNILKFENTDLFARASILEILLNTWISDHDHNRRIAIDVWSGISHIIPHDLSYKREKISEENFQSDKSARYLFHVINQSSNFLNAKYETLFKVVKEEKIFNEIIQDLEILKAKYLISQKTDLGKIKRKYVNFLEWSGPENEQSFNDLIESLKYREKQIISFLEKDPECSWNVNKKGFEVKIQNLIPISNLLVKFNNESPEWVALDYNNNQILDKEDKYFYKKTNGNFKINIKLFANRITSNLEPYSGIYALSIGKTKFTFFTENNKKPSKLITFNDHSKKELELNYDESLAAGPSLNNIAIIKDDKKNLNILSGNIFLEEDLIIKDETKILEGTTFTMNEGVSIIFENKVKAIGSKKRPIIFKKNDAATKWGAVALHGAKTEGSLFKNIIIENASGKSINGINYFASLSVHSAKNIKFDNILIKNNSSFDDMMHIIYSSNIQVINSNFLNAYKDSIDVDISKNILFQNLKIMNSGNDGIDFMESTAQLHQVNILNSGDKAVSIGENSKVLINDSILSSNNYGVASKDLSKTIIKNSLLENNKIQLGVYKKNWRYGGSGIIEVTNSKIIAMENYIKADEMGKISVLSSEITGALNKTQNVKIN
ncbi:CotH kinase family protein [Candidatus Pelagibacter sp.]|nr:CotH kinase family protein [Candidatus Pelagibacter sp.]